MSQHIHPVLMACIFLVIASYAQQTGYAAEQVIRLVQVAFVVCIAMQVLKSTLRNHERRLH